MEFEQLPPGVGPKIPEEDFCTEAELTWLTKMLSLKTRTEDDWTEIKDLLYKRLVYSAVPQKPGMKNYSRNGLLYIAKDDAVHVATCKDYLLETLKENQISMNDCMLTVMYFEISTSMALDVGCNLMIDAGNKKAKGFLHLFPKESRLVFARRTATLTDEEKREFLLEMLRKNKRM